MNWPTRTVATALPTSIWGAWRGARMRADVEACVVANLARALQVDEAPGTNGAVLTVRQHAVHRKPANFCGSMGSVGMFL